MVDPKRFDLSFTQRDKNTCLLAGYAVVNNYYTGQPIEDAFPAYCEHHKCSLTGDDEKDFMDHCWNHRPDINGRQPGGSERMFVELHRVSVQPYFANARKIFTGEAFEKHGITDRHLQMLEKLDALLVIGFDGGMTHVVTVGITSDRRYVLRDTNNSQLEHADSLEGIRNLHWPNQGFTDGMLYYPIGGGD